jgi:hypothetical protein
MADLTTSLGNLRDFLLKIKPAGSDGFEGLVADALAATTGLVFRLAKSGSQFGRDAMTAPAYPFAVAMEAKRYSDNLTLEHLRGKAGIAADALKYKIDLWVLAATSAVGDNIQLELEAMLANSGISLLTLDWTPHPLPPLAVLLALARDKVEAWFGSHHSVPAGTNLSAIFDAIIADPSFPAQRDQLLQSMSASNVGLDALRIHSTKWLRERFANPAKSQLAFGQYITVANPAATVIDRDEALKALGDAAVSTLATPDALGLIVVLGEEGCGKTWVIARWLAQMAAPPIVLFVAGRRTALLDPAKPVRSLANLFAEQDGKSNEAAIAAWERRLERWGAAGAARAMRFVIVLDGLNEHTGKPWASILKSMVPTVIELGGCVIASCRPAYWEREIRVRLGDFPLHSLVVAGYSEQELVSILSGQGIDPAVLPAKLREFIRNPRVCAVALTLLPCLGQHGALTVERLLLEYWRARLEERGDLISHNPKDFEKLLRSHAKEWVANPETPFDRNKWSERSPAASGNHGKDFANDLTDIEEGQFMQVSDDDDGSYEFKQEALPFAIGLLITDELKRELKTGKKTGDPRELLQRILEPIRGFDVMGEVVTTATGLACIEQGYPHAARVALVEASLSMQNPGDNLLDGLTAYVSECTDAFLDVVELRDSSVRQKDILALLLYNRDQPCVRKALNVRLPRWLGRWSRQFSNRNGGGSNKHQEDHEAHIVDPLDKMTPIERDLFAKDCFEASGSATVSISYLTAVLMAGRSQAHLAQGLFASRLAAVVAPDIYAAKDDLVWAVRLNTVDFLETEKALMQRVDVVSPGATEPFQSAVASTLRLIGSRDAATKANDLLPQRSSKRSRAIDLLCDTNPYDPGAPIGSNLENARIAISKIPAAIVWNHFSQTSEDRRLTEVTPALARFDSVVIVSALCDVINSIEARTLAPLRQLAFHLPRLSPLFNAAHIDLVMAAFIRLIDVPGSVQSSDLDFVALQIVTSLTPHLDASAQMELLLKLPTCVPASGNLQRALKVLAADRLEHYLELARSHPESAEMGRVLLFASARPALLTPRACEIIVEQTNSQITDIGFCAADIIYMARDDMLDQMFLNQAAPYSKAEDGIYAKTMLRRAIAMAVIRQKRSDLLHLVSPQFMGHVANSLGGAPLHAPLHALLTSIDCALQRLLQPILTPAPATGKLVINTSFDGLKTTIWLNDQHESNLDQDDDMDTKLKHFLTDSDPDGNSFDIKQEKKQREITAFKVGLAKEAAIELIENLEWQEAVLAVQHDAAQVSRWLDQILANTDQQIQSNIYNFGIVLAGAYATHDASKAIKVLEHLHDTKSIVNIIIGEERIPLYLQMLFKTASAATFVTALDPLRERFFTEAFTDAELETGVISADACGASGWLDDYMNRMLASHHPGEQARGLTIAGLRHKNALAQSALAQSWGYGFLGEVAAHARKIYQKNEWAYNWFSLTTATDAPIDFWRYGQLAQGIADRRFSRWLDDLQETPMWQRFGAELVSGLKTAAEKRSDKRKETLFGLKAPHVSLRFALLN